MRNLSAVSMHVSTGLVRVFQLVTIFPAYCRKKVSLLPIENLRFLCTRPLWQRSGEGALLWLFHVSAPQTTVLQEKIPRHCPTARERQTEHPGHEPASQTQNVQHSSICPQCSFPQMTQPWGSGEWCQIHSMAETQTCSSVPQDFLFVELDVSLEITLGAQGGEALESLKMTSGAQSRFYDAITIKRSLSSH